MNEAFHLSRLQRIDTQLDQISQRMAEISRLLENNENVKSAEARVQAAGKTVDQAGAALKKLEDAVQGVRMKMELSEKALYGGKVRNPKELQDLQAEIASLKRHLATLEDQQLEAMLALEDAESQHQSVSDELAKTVAAFTSQSASLVGERSKLKKDEERLQAERGAITAQVPPALIENYDQLRKQKRGVAVALIVEGSCTACGSELPPAEWQAARSPHRITYCSSCGRILYAG